MSYEQCTYSPESVADCWPTSFSDTSQLSLLSGNHTPAKSCANEPPKDGSPNCTCGKEMSDCSIHPSTPEKWIASMRDSLAKTLALLESRQAYLREPDQGFTEKSCVLLTSLDRDTCSWRMLQQSFLTDSEPFSQTWPRWGMTQGGYAYAHPMSERRITATGGGYWQTPVADDSVNREKGKFNSRGEPKLSARVKMFPTPTVSSGAQVAWDKTPGQTGGTTLEGYVRWFPTPNTQGYRSDGELAILSKVATSEAEFIAMSHRAAKSKREKYWPTPTAHNAKSESQRNTPTLAAQAGGKLNPDWVGWLMGFPIGWANSKDMETRKSRSKPQPHGDCSEVAK